MILDIIKKLIDAGISVNKYSGRGSVTLPVELFEFLFTDFQKEDTTQEIVKRLVVEYDGVEYEAFKLEDGKNELV